MKTFPSLVPALFILLLLITACMPRFGGDAGPEHAETYYLDAPNGFAMEYPAEWIRERKTASTVVWQPPSGEDGTTDVTATVTSFSPTDVPGGDDRMLNDFEAAHPGFALASEEETDLSGAPSALRVQGHTPDRVILAYFITARQRAFILEFSAPPQTFDSYRPVFEEMAESFRVVE